MIRGVLALDSETTAVAFKGREISWKQLRHAVEACDTALAAAGADSGARIGVLLRNTASHLVPMLSVLTTDRCMVTLNPHLPDEKLAADIRAMACPVVIATASDLGRPAIADAVRETGGTGLILTGDWSDPLRVADGLDGRDGAKAELAPGIAILMLTSGTTGAPKRVPLTAKSFEASLIGALKYERDRSPDSPPQVSDDTIVHFTSFVHIGGIFNAMRAMLCGRKLYLLEKFNVEEWADAVQRFTPLAASLPPAALRMILDANVPPEKLASLKAVRSSTAPLNQNDADEFERRYGAPVLQNYGATEFAGGVAGWTMKDYRTVGASKRGSVGRIHEGVEARIVDSATGAALEAGCEGILELRSEEFSTGRNWMRTSDRAVLDADQFLWIRGRADDAIIRGGFKVHPPEVVDALESHPAVREAVVVGLPDERLGAVPAAAVMLKTDAGVTEADLKTWLRGHLTPYQVPALIAIVEDVPRTVSLKPALPQVRELLAARRMDEVNAAAEGRSTRSK